MYEEQPEDLGYPLLFLPPWTTKVNYFVEDRLAFRTRHKLYIEEKAQLITGAIFSVVK